MINKLIRNSIKNIEPYIGLRSLSQLSDELEIPEERILKLDGGENFYVKDLNKKLSLDFTRYPDPDCLKLTKKLAEYTGLKKELIICGNGSNELLDLISKIFISEGDEVIINPPTFSMYEQYAKIYGSKIIKVPRKQDFNIDLPSIKKAINSKTKVIFLDSPGNPTSKVTSLSEIETLLRLRKILVIDEAYFEYSGVTATKLLKKYPNLIILRTLSKWAGLAGLRVGYLLANPEVVVLIKAVKSPYSVNSAAQEAACFILEKKKVYLERIKKLTSKRNRVINIFSKISQIKVYPSQGAYILFTTAGPAEKLQDYLKFSGCLVRNTSRSIPNSLRINLIRPREANQIAGLIRSYYETCDIVEL